MMLLVGVGHNISDILLLSKFYSWFLQLLFCQCIFDSGAFFDWHSSVTCEVK